MHDTTGNVIGWRGVGSDITDVRLSGSDAVSAARRDPLTGLANRLLVREHLEEALFNQLDGRETPAESPWTGPLVLQLLYCRACDDWEAFSKAHLVRAVPAGELVPPAATAAARLPFRAIVRWETIPDSPHPEEQERLGLHLEYDFKAKRVAVRCPEFGVDLQGLDSEAADAEGREVAEAICMAAQGDKLGGWPSWVQGAEYPACARCGQEMRYLFQVDSNGGVDHMFGDLGCGHVSRCEAHPEVLAFTWACS